MPIFSSQVLYFILGALSIFSFAPFNFYFLQFIIFVTFFYLLKNSKNLYRSSLFFGFGFFSTGLYWLIPCIVNYGGASWMSATLLCGTFFCFLSLFFIPLSLIKRYGALAAISSLILLEILREYFLTGFPWLSLGFSQVDNILINSYFPVLGSHGVSLILIVISYLIYQLLFEKKYINLLTIFLIIILNFLIKIAPYKDESLDSINISLLQGNVSQAIKWDKNAIDDQVLKYTSLLEDAEGTLIIFPETAIPLTWANMPEKLSKVIKAKVEKGKTIIIGSIFELNNQYLNGAAVLSNKSDAFYFKEHLVPFGEYFPLSDYLGFIYKNILNIPFSNLASPSIKNDVLKYENIFYGINICYEDIFKHSYDRYLPTPNFFINLTNDAWYDKSPASYQHAQISQARAKEFHKPIVRATNTGVTALIDSQGNITESLPQFSTGILNVKLKPNTYQTTFSKLGELPLISLLIFLIFANKFPLFALLKRKKKVKS